MSPVTVWFLIGLMGGVLVGFIVGVVWQVMVFSRVFRRV